MNQEHYLVTGIHRDTGKRVRLATDNYGLAWSYPVSRGTVYKVDKDGKRRIMKRVRPVH